MSDQPKKTAYVFILAGNSHEYTEARRKLDLTPSQTFWLTSPVNLKGKENPKVYRFGAWKLLGRLREIETAMAEVGAEVIDIS